MHDRISKKLINALAPKQQWLPSEWLAKFAVIPKTVSKRPGPFRLPKWFAYIIDTLVTSPQTKIRVVRSGQQVGKTSSLIAIILFNLFVIEQNCLIVAHDGITAEEIFKNLKLIVAASPRLKKYLPLVRRGDNTVRGIRFRNGTRLRIATAGSAGTLKSFSAGCVILDEADQYPDEFKREGDPIEVAEGRSASFGDSANVWITSTPKTEHDHITVQYKKSLCAEWHITCPNCQIASPLIWEQMQWKQMSDRQLSEQPSNIHWECLKCNHQVGERQFRRLCDEGQFIQEDRQENKSERNLGFHVPGILSPMVTWIDFVIKFRAASMDKRLLQSFYNLQLGLPFSGNKTVITDHRLKELVLSDLIVGECPEETLAIHIGIDLGHKMENQDYDYHCAFVAVLPANQYVVLSAIHTIGTTSLRDALNNIFTTPQGRQIQATFGFIDSGYMAQTYIYELADTLGLVPIKGDGSHGREELWWAPPSKLRKDPIAHVHKQINLGTIFDYIKYKQLHFVSGLPTDFYLHMASWEWDGDTKKWTERKKDIDDHYLDATRYALASFLDPRLSFKDIHSWDHALKVFPDLAEWYLPPPTEEETKKDQEPPMPERIPVSPW